LRVGSSTKVAQRFRLAIGQALIRVLMAPKSASARSNTAPSYARQPVVERRKSMESPALSGGRQDLSPCSKVLGWPRVLWSIQRAIIVEGGVGATRGDGT
jgi:hypothetical protein